MKRESIATGIAIFSLVVYVLSFIVCVYGLIQVSDIHEEYGSVKTVVNIALAFGIFVSIVMAVLSVLLLKGIKEKSHKLMAPWVYCTIVAIVLNIFGLVSSPNGSNILMSILKIAIQIALLYPIYTLYNDTKRGNLTGVVLPEQNVGLFPPQNVVVVSTNTAPYPNAGQYPNTGPYPNNATSYPNAATYPNTAPYPNAAPYSNATPYPNNTAPYPNAAPYPNTAPYPNASAESNVCPYPNNAPQPSGNVGWSADLPPSYNSCTSPARGSPQDKNEKKP